MNAILLTGVLAMTAPAADDSLRAAIERGDVEKVKQYIDAKADLNRLVVVPEPAPDPKKLFEHQSETDLMRLQARREHNAHVELPLTLAITTGKKEIVKLLLESGAEPGKQMTNGRTAVHCALRVGDLESLKLLIEHKAPLGTADLRGVTPLMLALGENREEAGLLLKAGADPNPADLTGKTALHHAVDGRNLTAVVALLEYKADPNKADKLDVTPLHQAVKYRHAAMVEKLLAAGAKAETWDADGRSALVSALWVGEIDLARRLLDAGAKVDSRNPAKSAALHTMVWSPPAVRFLLAHKADVNVRDGQGRTPLHLAVEWLRTSSRSCEAVVSLLRGGADQGLKDDKGRTPFDLAAEIKSYAACRVLALHQPKPPEVDPLKVWDEKSPEREHYLEVRKGLDDGTLKPDSLTANGTPLLVAAASAGEEALVELLIARGADVNARLKDRSSALYHAALGESWLATKRLLDAGADVKDQGGVFGPLLTHVVEEGDVELARLLLAKGADPNRVEWHPVYQNKLTPLHVAALLGSTALTKIKPADPSMIELLLEYKADPKVRDDRGQTPLDYAGRQNKKVIIELLQR